MVRVRDDLTASERDKGSQAAQEWERFLQRVTRVHRKEAYGRSPSNPADELTTLGAAVDKVMTLLRCAVAPPDSGHGREGCDVGLGLLGRLENLQSPAPIPDEVVGALQDLAMLAMSHFNISSPTARHVQGVLRESVEALTRLCGATLNVAPWALSSAFVGAMSAAAVGAVEMAAAYYAHVSILRRGASVLPGTLVPPSLQLLRHLGGGAARQGEDYSELWRAKMGSKGVMEGGRLGWIEGGVISEEKRGRLSMARYNSALVSSTVKVPVGKSGSYPGIGLWVPPSDTCRRWHLAGSLRSGPAGSPARHCGAPTRRWSFSLFSSPGCVRRAY